MKLKNIFKKMLILWASLFFLSTSHAQTGSSNNLLSQIVQDMPGGSWVQANQNSWQSVWTPAQNQVLPGNSYGANIGGIIYAWSGFAWDSNLGEMILYGGGHANYGGNDVYIFQSSTMQWVRASLPTQLQAPVTLPNTGGQSVYYTVDNGNAPQSAHTYDNDVYLPTLDRYLTFGGNTFTNNSSGLPYMHLNSSGVNAVTGPFLFNANLANGNKVGGATGTGVDPTTPGGNMWQNLDIYANLPNAPLPPTFQDGKASVAEINGQDVVYVSAQDPGNYGYALFQYNININNPSLSKWTQVGSPHPTTWFNQGAGAYDAQDNIFLHPGVHQYVNWGVSHPDMDFLYWDLSKAGSANVEKGFGVGYGLTDNTGGAFDFSNLTNYGLDYNPLDHRFYLWGGGNNVYSLTHTGNVLGSGWVLAIDGVLGANSGPGGTLKEKFPSAGVLGKWHWASDLAAFVGLDDHGNVWVYKPADQPPYIVTQSQVTTTSSSLVYSSVSNTYNGTVTINNISSNTIRGPLEILFTGVSANVTLVNAISTLSGTPYLNVPAANLAPGQSATVSVQFSNPSNAIINFTPVIYSGSISGSAPTASYPVPLPAATLLMMASGLIAIGAFHRRKTQA